MPGECFRRIAAGRDLRCLQKFPIGGVRRGRVPPDDPRQGDGQGPAVRHLEAPGQRVRAGVGGAEHGPLDRGAGKKGAELHVFPFGGVRLARDGIRKSAAQECESSVTQDE